MEIAVQGSIPLENPIRQRLAKVTEKPAPFLVADKVKHFHRATDTIINMFGLEHDLDLKGDEPRFLGQMIEYHVAKKALQSVNVISAIQLDEVYIDTLKALKVDELLPTAAEAKSDDREYRYLHSISFAALEFVNFLFPDLAESGSTFEKVQSIFSQQNTEQLEVQKAAYKEFRQDNTGERYGFKAYKLRIAQDRERLATPLLQSTSKQE